VTKKEQYVAYRLEGYGTRRAAERAGFAGGVPSPGARQLWQLVQVERGCDPHERSGELRTKIREQDREIRKLQSRVDEHRQTREWLQRKLEAVAMLEECEPADM
jgi:uncharacterized coiled-coil protein SlyX